MSRQRSRQVTPRGRLPCLGNDSAEDLYPDVVPCLKQLREAGTLVGIAGNQPVGTEHALRALCVSTDIVASSPSWGVEKPDTRFSNPSLPKRSSSIRRIYVGDRLDDDVEPRVWQAWFRCFCGAARVHGSSRAQDGSRPRPTS